MNPLARERRSRDTRPQPAWRHPATPCKAAQPPPPPAMKRLALLLPLLALAVTARAEDPAAKEAMESARLSEVEARILSLSTEPTEEEKRAVVSAVDALSENERIELTRRLPIVYGGQFVLDYLAHDSRKDVRLGVSLNRWTPKESLQFLCDDSEEDIRLSATNNLESVRVLRLNDLHGRIEPFILDFVDDNPVVRSRLIQQQKDALFSLDGLSLRACRTHEEALAVLSGIVEKWPDRPYAAYVEYTNLLRQVSAFQDEPPRSAAAESFHAASILRTLDLPVPTNLFPVVESKVHSLRWEMREQAWAAGAETISIQTVLKIAELRARFAKQSESIRKLVAVWSNQEPAMGETREEWRNRQQWEDRDRFLKRRLNWSLEDTEIVHTRLFSEYPSNLLLEKMKGWTTERQRKTLLELLNRADLDEDSSTALRNAVNRTVAEGREEESERSPELEDIP